MEENSSRLASKYLALSHENELLRFKLKEQEIQLEGTKAKLRILEKNGQSEAASLKMSLVPLDSLPRTHGIPKDVPSHSAAEERSSQLQHLSTSSPFYSIPSDSSPDKNTTEEGGYDSRQCPDRPSNPPIKCSQSQAATPHSSSSALLRDCRFPPPSHHTTPNSSNPEVKTSPGRNDLRDRIDLNLSDQLEKCEQYEVNEKELGGQRLNVRSGVSRIPTRIMSPPVPPPPQTHQSIGSKSPGSSLSSKSSIPVAVTRLKRNESIRSSGNPTSTTKKSPASNFWATWFAN